METTTNPNLLADIEQEMQFEYASTGQRFVNFIVDYAVYMLIYYIVLYVLASNGVNVLDPIGNLPIVFSVFIVLYTIIEFFAKGKSLGKLFTRTRAVRKDGANLSFKNALLRTLVRLVPFEVFSGFNMLTWHDQWTNTMVVRERR